MRVLSLLKFWSRFHACSMASDKVEKFLTAVRYFFLHKDTKNFIIIMFPLLWLHRLISFVLIMLLLLYPLHDIVNTVCHFMYSKGYVTAVLWTENWPLVWCCGWTVVSDCFVVFRVRFESSWLCNYFLVTISYKKTLSAESQLHLMLFTMTNKTHFLNKTLYSGSNLSRLEDNFEESL